MSFSERMVRPVPGMVPCAVSVVIRSATWWKDSSMRL